MNSKESPLRFTLFLIVLFLLSTQLVHTQESSTFDYDLKGQRVTYYPESLMLSRTPAAIVFIRIPNYLTCLLICAHLQLAMILPLTTLAIAISLTF